MNQLSSLSVWNIFGASLQGTEFSNFIAFSILFFKKSEIRLNIIERDYKMRIIIVKEMYSQPLEWGIIMVVYLVLPFIFCMSTTPNATRYHTPIF